MNLLILFPNQIFERKHIVSLLEGKKIDHIVLLEHPVFFGTDPNREINFNKMKLVLHRASFYFYFDYLREEFKHVQIGHIKIDDFKSMKRIIKKYKKVYYIDNPDYLLDKRMKDLRGDVQRIDDIHPNFLLSRGDIDEYVKTKKGGYFHKHFYEWSRRRFDVLMDEKKPVGGQYSYDTYNRSGPPTHLKKLPKLPKLDKGDSVYIESAKKEIEKEFPDNYGSVDLYVPVTFEGAEKWFDDFLKNRLPNFGKYEDAVVRDEPFLYHSVISPLMNCGLLCPKDVIEKVLDYFVDNYEEGELLYSVEGFIRQVMGWREWQRLIYIKEYVSLKLSNFYGHNLGLNEKWYTGELGVPPIDDTIKSGYKHAYLHHILRLMYMSNFMNLCRIHPHEMYYWFMSFSMDSYDWVMIQNVYSMGAFSDGGLTMTKPYVTTGNYILKMSNYKKGPWVKLWSDLYYNFLSINMKKLEKFPRVSWMMKRNLDSKSDKEMKEITQSAEKFISGVTREL
jgi:deoxyribodipyrimidine photolyase-related protein